MSHTTAKIIERLEVLFAKLDDEGLYVSATTVSLAIERLVQLNMSPARAFECAARKQGTAGGNDPADCDWPHCGCDQ